MRTVQQQSAYLTLGDKQKSILEGTLPLRLRWARLGGALRYLHATKVVQVGPSAGLHACSCCLLSGMGRGAGGLSPDPPRPQSPSRKAP